MIRRKKKICKRCKKERVLFGRGLCATCYRIVTAREAVLKRQERRSPRKGSKPPPRRESPLQRLKKPLKRVSDKRVIEAVAYKVICDAMDAEKPHICFLCGNEIKGRIDHHHLDGRHEHYLKEEWIVKAHGKCHRQYHDDPVETIAWFDGFLVRLKEKNIQLFEREIWKLEK